TETSLSRLEVRAVDGGETVTAELGDLAPSDLEWADAWTLLVAGDLHSSGAILQVDAATGQSRTLAGDGVFSSLSVAEDGTVYALRSDVGTPPDRKSTRLNSSHVKISYAVFCLKKKMQHSM